MDDVDHSMGSKIRVCCWVRFNDDDDFNFALRRPLGWHAAVVYLSKLIYFTWEAAPRMRLRTRPRHPRLLKLHPIYNPPLHLLAFFYSQLTPWYCFSKRVLRIKSIAFFVYGGCVNIFFHSTTPNGSLRRSSFHISCLRRLNFRHSIRMCRTVCEVWPHSHRSSSTIFRLTSFEHVRLLSRDLQTSPQIVHMHKSCIDDDNKVFQTVT